MNQMPHLIRISQLLSRFDGFMIAENRGGEYSANDQAEYILLKILKIIFNTSTLEKKRNRFPAIDLGDSEKRFSIQITSRNDQEKVKQTIHKFIIHRLFENFDTNYVLIVGQRKESYSQGVIDKQIKKSFEELKNAGNLGATSVHFDVQQHIFDIYDIRQLLKEKDDFNAIIAVKKILEEVFADEQTQSDAELKEEFKRQLKIIEQHISLFNPNTALLEVNELEKAISESILNDKDKNLLLAKCYYSKAIAFSDSDKGDKESVNELLIKAYNYDRNNIRYQESAVISYFRFNEIEKANELCDKILLKDEFNARAWAYLKLRETKIDIPKIVRKNPVFRQVLITLIPKNSENVITLESLDEILSDTLTDLTLPNNIQINNIYYYDSVSHYLFGCYQHKENIANKEALFNYTIELSQKIQDVIKETDFEKRLIFRISSLNLYYALYLRENRAEYADNIYHLLQDSLIRKNFDFKIPEIIHCFWENGESEKSLNLLQYLDVGNNPNLYLLKANVYLTANKINDALDNFENLILEINNIDEQAFYNTCFAIERIYNLRPDVKKYEEIICKKTYKEPYLALLLEAFVLSFNPQHDNAVKVILKEFLEKPKLDFKPNIQNGIASCLYRIGELDTLINYIESDLDYEFKNPMLFLYILTLHKKKVKMPKLYELLELWRKKFTPEPMLLQMEAHLARVLDDKHRQEEIGKYGITTFPSNDSYKYVTILALHSLGKREELKTYLNESILNLNLDPMSMLQLGDICFSNQLTILGLDIFYKILKGNRSNVEIKNAYFGYLTANEHLENLELPLIVAQDCVVRLKIDGKDEVLEITQDSISTNPIVKKIIGMPVNNKVSINDFLTGKRQEAEITVILDKYRGQLAVIGEEIGKVSSGLKFKSFKADGDIHKLLEIMQQEFGPDAIKRDIFVKEQFSKFKNGEIGFSDLLRGVFDDNPFDTFQYITSDFNDGFPIVPLVNQPDFNFEDSSEFVIDFSVIPTLMIVSKLGNIQFNNKSFIIPIDIINYLQFKIEEIHRIGTPNMWLNFQQNRIDRHPFPSDNQSKTLSELISTLEWINQYCKVDYGISGLDLRVQNPDFFKIEEPNDWYKRCILNTMILGSEENRILITDDLFNHRNPFTSSPITLEYYLKKVFKDNFDEIAVWELLKLNYRGITINAKHLQRAFELDPTLSNPKSIFQKCHHNISWFYNPSRKVLNETFKFLKYLYSLDLSLGYKQQISQKLLYFALEFLQQYDDLEKDLKSIINEFKFLGNHFLNVQWDVILTLKLLEEQRGIKSKNKKS